MPRKAQIASYVLAIVLALIAGMSIAEEQVPDVTAEQNSSVERIPYKTDSSQENVSFGRLIGVMFLLLLVAAAVIYILRYSNFAGKITGQLSKNIDLLEFRRLSPKLTVYLVAIEAKKYVITQSGDHTCILEHFSTHSEIERAIE